MSPADLFKTFPGFPILLSALLLMPAAARALPDGRIAQLGPRLIGAAVGATALLALLLAFANLLVPDYVDNVEPTVVGNAWIWWQGGQLYPLVGPGAGAGGTELRGLLYGPLTFLLAGIAPVLLGPSVVVSKLPPVGLFLGVVALTWFACRRAGAPPRTALLAAAAMTTVLGISEAPYWVRGDPVLMLIGALSAWLTAQPARRPLGTAILLGLLAGTASAVKLHGAAYVAPACLMATLDAAGWPVLGGSALAPRQPAPGKSIDWRDDWRDDWTQGDWKRGDWKRGDWKRGMLVAGLIAAAALVAVAWPFVLRGVPLDGYVSYLKLAAKHGFSTRLFLGNLTLLLGVCLPILVLARDARAGDTRGGRGRGLEPGQLDRAHLDTGDLAPRWLLLAGAAFACALPVALVAGKPGAGYPHLLPFLPYAALLLSRILPERPAQPEPSPRLFSRSGVSFRLLAVGALFCLAFCVPVLVRAATFATRGAEFAAIGDGSRQVHQVMQLHSGKVVAVGYGGGSFLDLRLSYLRVLPVFGGNPLFYDATAMDDLWQGGVDRAIALREIDRCGVWVWLIPDDEPFTIRNFYGGFTFSEEFRTHFAARYQQEKSAGPFRVWTCRPFP